MRSAAWPQSRTGAVPTIRKGSDADGLEWAASEARPQGPQAHVMGSGADHRGRLRRADGGNHRPRSWLLYRPEGTRHARGHVPVHRAAHHLCRDGSRPLLGIPQERPRGLSNS